MPTAPTAAGGLTGPSARTYRTLGLGCLATLLLQYLIPVRPPAFLLKESPTRPLPHHHRHHYHSSQGEAAEALRGGGPGPAAAQQQLVLEGGGPPSEWRVGEGFKGRAWRTNQTVSVSRVVSTPFGICELHTVTDPLQPGQVLSDWLWFDEKDQVNVLAQLQQGQGRPPAFLVFRTRKYGLQGESLSPIGGLVEPGEEAQEAARRELLEEAGLVSGSWVSLGRFRISSTRGGGHLNVFLAQDCRPAPPHKQRPKSDDREAQERFELSELQLEEALLAGAFKEAKWTQTVAMALLWIRRQQQPVAARDGLPALPALATL